jgi:hypothetical protein
MKFRRFAAGSDAGGHLRAINSPWGLASLRRGLADMQIKLLVGNFGSGTIMAFESDRRVQRPAQRRA